MLSRKHFPIKGQEARLYMPCVAAVVLPVSMFIYAWTASPNIPWIAPLIGLTVRRKHVISQNFQVPDLHPQAFMTGTSVIFQVSILYIADWYASDASILPMFDLWIQLRPICLLGSSGTELGP